MNKYLLKNDLLKNNIENWKNREQTVKNARKKNRIGSRGIDRHHFEILPKIVLYRQCSMVLVVHVLEK